MHASHRVTAILTIWLIATNMSLFAWDGLGHMAVGYVAYNKLTTKTKTRVNVLLHLNPDYNKWVGLVPTGTPAKFKRRMVFMIAATWPDQIKGESGFTDDGTDGGNRPDGPPSSQNTGYSDHLRHRYFHFVDMPFTQDGTTHLPAIPMPNAEERITLFRGVLASSDPDELKSYDLTWLLHLVGDVHQPLHCATRVSSTQTDGDQGGNLVKICNPGCGAKLHAFWDEILGTSNDPNTAVTLAQSLAPPPATDASKSDAADWVNESFDQSKTNVYVAPIAAGEGPFTITSAYKSAARMLAKKRISLAGIRLANLLNTELK
jgi:hypothetical protein